jgi:hypothetical protein
MRQYPGSLDSGFRLAAAPELFEDEVAAIFDLGDGIEARQL